MQKKIYIILIRSFCVFVFWLTNKVLAKFPAEIAAADHQKFSAEVTTADQLLSFWQKFSAEVTTADQLALDRAAFKTDPDAIREYERLELFAARGLPIC